ncbi:phage holin family protein [Pseudactinotalea terrae]|uniref:phage holin family protein n=1 Tax=Pseudactinotalea terrae TaxID=1743262 RepID=UPI0012E28C65|nr:phage holin family protein [Pseudactinotalea terrae]
MIRLVLRLAVYLGSAAIGLLVAALLIDGVEVGVLGFVVAVVVFALTQSLLTPVVTALARKYANAFVGGMGLVATLVALLVANALTDGLRITGGITTWILATLVVWLVTAAATVLLPTWVLKDDKVDQSKKKA